MVASAYSPRARAIKWKDWGQAWRPAPEADVLEPRGALQGVGKEGLDYAECARFCNHLRLAI